MPSAYAYTPHIWPMLFSAVISAALGIYAWRQRGVPGATGFIALEFFTALWALLTAIEIAATTSQLKILYHNLEAMAAVMALAGLLYFALEQASPGKWATRRTAQLLILIALVIAILVATNDFHHLVWTRIWFDRFVRVERGPLNPLIVVGTLLLPTIALLLFLRMLLLLRGVPRLQALVLFIGSALPLLAYFLEPAGINPVAPLDPVILMINVSSVLYILAIFRLGMLGVVPIGRDTAIERMADGVLILNTENRIVDLNPAARELLALSRGAAIGRPAGQALAAYPELVELLKQRTAASAEIAFQKAGESRYFQAQTSPLTHPRGFHLGWLILLQDVTERQRAQAQLQQQQWTQATLQERALLAQELHDGLSQNLAFLNLQTQAAQLYQKADQPDAVRASLARLAEASSEMQGEVRELIGNLLAVSLPSEGFCATLRQLITRFAEQTGLSVGLDIVQPAERLCDPARLPPATGVQLIRVAQEALANVRKHAGNPSEIGVRLWIEDGQVHLMISDNGAGFEPVRLETGNTHFGLQVMHQRAARIGGKLTVHSAPGQGTRIEVTVPLASEGGARRENPVSR